MSFQLVKDNIAIAAMTAIIGWSGAQLHGLNASASKLAEELVSMKRTQEFHAYRIDQQGTMLKETQHDISENKIKLGRIELRLFADKN